MRPCFVGLVSVVAALVVLPPPTQAQEESLGVTTGLTSSNFWREETWDHDRTTVALGIFLEFRLRSFLRVRPEISWVRKGAQHSTNFGRETPTQYATFDYLQLPVLFQFNLASLQQTIWRPTVFAGPSLGVMVSCWVGFRETGVLLFGGPAPPSDCGSAPFLDIGAVAGFGIARALGRTTLHLDARLDLGIRSVDSPSDIGNRTIGLNFGVSYALQR